MEASGSTPRRRAKPAPEETKLDELVEAASTKRWESIDARLEDAHELLTALRDTTITRLDRQDERLAAIEMTAEPEAEISLSEQVAEIDQRVGDTLERVERLVKDAIELQDQPQPNRLALAKAGVMADLSRVEKRGVNQEHGYDYATVADIAEEIRRSLSAHQIAVTTELDTISEVKLGVQTRGGREWVRWRVDFAITLTHGPSSECETVQWVGYAEDFGDKGLYKALSGGMKYWMIDTFLVSTGDDPESTPTGDEGGTVQRRPPAPPQRPARSGPAPRSANAFADPDARRRAIFGAAKRAKISDELLHEIIRYRLGVRSVNDVAADGVELIVNDVTRYGREASWREKVDQALADARLAWDAEDAEAAAEDGQDEPQPQPDAEGEAHAGEATGEAQEGAQEPPGEPDENEAGVQCPDCAAWLAASDAAAQGISLDELLARHRASPDCIPF